MWHNTTTGDGKNLTTCGQNPVCFTDFEILCHALGVHTKSCLARQNQHAEVELLWQTLFSTALNAPVEDLTVQTASSFLAICLSVSIICTSSLSLTLNWLSSPLACFWWLHPDREARNTVGNREMQRGRHPLPHAGAPVIPAAPQTPLFLTAPAVLSYWTDRQEVEDLKRSRAESLIHPTDTPRPYLRTQARKYDHPCCSSHLSMMGPELWGPWVKRVGLKNEVENVWSIQSFHVGNEKDYWP